MTNQTQKTKFKFLAGIFLIIGIIAAAIAVPLAVAGTLASITPASPLTTDTLTCNPSGYLYQWYRNGQASVTTQTVNPSLTAKNDVWNCHLQVQLPTGSVYTVDEASATILNSDLYWTNVANQTTPENTPLSFTIQAGDNDADEGVDTIIYSINDSSGLNFTLINQQTGEIIFTPSNNFNGDYNIDVSAGDGTASITAPVTITVTCTPSITNTTWSDFINDSCSGDQMNQSRFLVEYDQNECIGSVNITYYEYQFVGPSLTNTTWTDFYNITSCLSGDYFTQEQNLTQYDDYGCAANTTFVNQTNETCDFCIPLMANTTLTDWSNESCVGNEMNQSQYWTEYDSNFCIDHAISNITYYNYQFVGPVFANTTWTDYYNLTLCQLNDTQAQERNLTQYDEFGCDVNATFTENQEAVCDFCSYNVTNATLTDWQNQTSCQLNDTILQNRSLTEYDSNYSTCYLVTLLDDSDLWNLGNNNTYWDYQEISCDFCTPSMENTTWSDWSNESCVGNQRNQSQYLVEYDENTCYALTGLSSDNVSNITYYNYQLVGPSLENTTWTDFYNITSCMLGDYYTQEQNLTQYDLYGCDSNQTFVNQTNETCDYCIPSIENTTWSDWYDTSSCQENDTKTQERNLTQYDANFCADHAIANQTFTESQEVSCNYCSYNVTNTTWTAWQDTGSCLVNDTQLQNRSLEEYDSNYSTCYLVTLLDDSDLWNLGNNNTYWEYQEISCDFCTPSMENTTWTDYYNLTLCQLNDTQLQERSLVQYDSNTCYELTGLDSDNASNQTFTEQQEIACIYTASNIFNSTINSIYYPDNFTELDSENIFVSEINDSTLLNNLLVNISTIISSNINLSTIQNSTIQDSNFTNCTILDSIANRSSGKNCYIDPTLIVDSNTDGSTIRNSTVISSNATNSNVTGSTINTSDVNNSAINLTIIEDSDVRSSILSNATISDSTLANANLTGTNVTSSSTLENVTMNNSDINSSVVINTNLTDSGIENSTVTDTNLTNATLTNATLENVTTSNSVIENSSIDNTIISDANITNDVIYNGTIVDANNNPYNATASGQRNLTDLINSAPSVVITDPINGSSKTENANINFIAEANDINIGTLLNDSLTFLWDFNDSITSTEENPTHSFNNARIYNITLTVTDNFGETDSYSILINIIQSSKKERGGNGAGTNQTNITETNATNATNITQPVCKENWVCADWSPCINNTQARTCTDKNSCGTIKNRHATTRTCTAEKSAETKPAGNKFFSFITGNAIFNSAANFVKGIPAFFINILNYILSFILNLINMPSLLTKIGG